VPRFGPGAAATRRDLEADQNGRQKSRFEATESAGRQIGVYVIDVAAGEKIPRKESPASPRATCS